MLRSLALTALLLAVAAVPASAGTMSTADGRLVFTAGDGETNQLSLTMIDTGPVIVRDTGAPVTGCGPWSHPEWPDVPDDVVCNGGSPKILLGDGNDAVGVSDAGTEMPIGTTEVHGGTGNDGVTTGISNDVLRGGAGNDDLNAGEQGDDQLYGDEGDDTLKGRWGNDTLDGGPGTDRIDAGYGDDTIAARDGVADVIDCDEGTDVVIADAGDTTTACEDVRLPTSGGTPPPVTGPVVTDTGAPRTTPAPLPGPAVVIPRGAEPQPAAPRDRTAPKLRVTRKGRTLTLRADEACSVTIRAGKRTLVKRLTAGRALKVRVPGSARTVKLTARDAAGNVAAVSRRMAR